MIATDPGPIVDVLPGVADPIRLAILHATGLVDREADATLDSFARLAAALLQAPNAYVTLVARDAQLTPGAAFEQDRASPPRRPLDLQESICQFQVVTGEPLLIGDTRTAPLSERKVAVRDGSLLAYAGVPLKTRGGHVLGSLCVVDQRPRHWTGKQVQLLGELAQLVMSDIEHRLSAGRVASVEALGHRTGQDAKSLLEAVSALVALAEREDDPRLQRSAARVRARSVAFERLAGELCAMADELVATTPADSSPVDLGRTVERAVAGARLMGTTDLDLVVPSQQVLITGDALRLEQALVHLLVSALHHKTPGERLQVRLACEQLKGVASRATATLTLGALGGQVPAAELARIVARFRVATSEADTPAGSATLRLVRGEVEARSGVVSGRSSALGTTFRAEWATTLPGDRLPPCRAA